LSTILGRAKFLEHRLSAEIGERLNFNVEWLIRLQLMFLLLLRLMSQNLGRELQLANVRKGNFSRLQLLNLLQKNNEHLPSVLLCGNILK
jgi:hypothetical protein